MSEHDEQVSLISWWELAHKRYRLPEYSQIKRK